MKNDNGKRQNKYEFIALIKKKQLTEADMKYKQLVFKLSDPEFNKIIDAYIKILRKLKAGNYLFSLETDKTRPIAQSNFSKKIEQVFYKVYKEPIALDFCV
jgi:hypothetical protein